MNKVIRVRRNLWARQCTCACLAPTPSSVFNACFIVTSLHARVCHAVLSVTGILEDEKPLKEEREGKRDAALTIDAILLWDL